MSKTSSLIVLKRLLVGLGMLALLSTLPVAWSLVRSTDREMRENLLTQASIAAKAIDIYALMKLKGTEADLQSPYYLRLKEQLATLRSANSQYRFLYIMGRNHEGKIFFYVDSEPDTSQDYSPPGQVYDESTSELMGVFQGQLGIVEGPLEDQWGTWVSAISPIFNPRTGAVIAVVGIDIGASKWHFDIAAHVLPSVGFMAAFLIMMLFSFYVAIKKAND